MRNIISVVVLSLFIIVSSCGKTAHNDPSPPLPPVGSDDSLFSWSREYESPAQVIIDIWFISASKGYYIGYDGYIYQSGDSGHTWTKGLQPGPLGGNSFFFVDSQYGFEQSNHQVAITKDAGQSFSIKNLPTSDAISIFFTSPSTGYYCDGDSGVYKTTDTCNTWQRVLYVPNTPPGYYIYFLDANNGFAFTGEGSFYKTIDGADTWHEVAPDVVPANVPMYNFGSPIYTLLFQNARTGYYASGVGLMKTTDGGITWNVSNANAPESIYGINVVTFPGVNTGYYYTNNTIYKTADAGQTWQLSARFINDQLNGLHFIDSTTGWGAGLYIYHLTK